MAPIIILGLLITCVPAFADKDQDKDKDDEKGGRLKQTLTALQAQVAQLQAELKALQSSQGAQDNQILANSNNLDALGGGLDLSQLTADMDDLNYRFSGVTRQGDTLLFTGLNLQVVNGSGKTDGPVNGLGNVIIGYNETIFPFLDVNLPASDKSGSHYLVVGKGLNYAGYGGVVAGLNNVSAKPYASVTGGNRNQAMGNFSSVSGGEMNSAEGVSSAISGGLNRRNFGLNDWNAGALFQND